MPGSSTISAKKKQQAIDLIASGVDQQTAAAAIGVDKSTITKWKKILPDFSNQINEKRESELASIRETYLQILKDSIESLKTVAKDPDHKSFAKIQEILARSVGLLDKLPDFSNAYRFKSHLDRDRFIELHEEQGRIWDRLSTKDREYIVSKLKPIKDVSAE